MTAAELKQFFRDTLIARRTITQEVEVFDALVDFITQALAIKEWSPGIYGSGLVIVMHDLEGDGTDRALYVLTEASRPFDSADFQAELIDGSWKRLGPSLLTISTAATDIYIDLKGGTKKRVKGSATIDDNKTIEIHNGENGQEIVFFFSTDDQGRQLTFESTVKMDKRNADWSSVGYQWTSPEAGDYKATLSNNGLFWMMEISNPY